MGNLSGRVAGTDRQNLKQVSDSLEDVSTVQRSGSLSKTAGVESDQLATKSFGIVSVPAAGMTLRHDLGAVPKGVIVTPASSVAVWLVSYDSRKLVLGASGDSRAHVWVIR